MRQCTTYNLLSKRLILSVVLLLFRLVVRIYLFAVLHIISGSNLRSVTLVNQMVLYIPRRQLVPRVHKLACLKRLALSLLIHYCTLRQLR
jgi:hypothetical protein